MFHLTNNMNRDQALELLHSNMQNVNLRRHCYAVEAVMRALAPRFKGDVDLWGITGLVHDADYEFTKETAKKDHTKVAAQWLDETGAGPEIINAVLAHAWGFVEGAPEPQNPMEWSLYTCDELTGLIVACALVKPDRKLATVTLDTIKKKWNQKAFAAGVNRDQIAMCETKLNITLDEFITIALNAMKGISSELGV